MRVSIFLLTVVLLVSGSASLQAQQPTPAARLAGTEWKLASFGGARAEIPVVEGTTITLKLGADGRAGGSSGCNSYGGDYQVRGNSISFGRIISTKRACTDPRANQQEQRYFRALGLARSFGVDGVSLTINTGASGTLNFVKTPVENKPVTGYEDLRNPTTLLASFYDAVNSKDYDRAYRYWETQPGSSEDFARGYRETVKVQLIVQPPTKIEGAAGSLYAEVRTAIIARQRNGSDRIFAGCYVTRQTNQGNSGEGIWRIYRANLAPAASAAAIPQLLDRACRN